ncbi:histidine kinase [Microbacterium sp. W1N]|uniref:sensor histidine kinase n=1 Tax=Microbacterium festucae TaxID=2977531 RepID=UPI0021BF6BD5|nr:histidine kinase [Microbacterium festucae]MCT9821270.1 histidine kinase [Microbacterium festucae]
MTAAPAPARPRRPVGAVIGRALFALVVGGALWALHLTSAATYPEFLQLWFLLIDPLLGVAAVVVVLAWGPRHPLAVALGAAAVALVSETAVGASFLALVAVAAGQRWRHIVVASVANVLALHYAGLLYPGATSARFEWWVGVGVSALIVGVVVATGVAMGQRRAVLAGLRERAEAAEREQAVREQAARVAERNRIAHDMHDVLAHRISLVALHAGAVGYRTDLTDAERAAAITAIEQNARAALTELRDVLGVLRSPDQQPGAPEPPQPGIGDIAGLVDEGRAAGMRIELVHEVEGVPPLIVSQAAYRIVREALSNARKHAPDAAVTVSLAGEDGEGLAVLVENTAPVAPPTDPLPGAGLGLVGLAERVEATGGRFRSGPRAGGGYALSAWLPWST